MYAAIESGVSGLIPSAVGGLGTTAKIFPALGKQQPAGTVSFPLTLLIPNNGQFEMEAFEVQASGNVTFGSTANPTINFVLQNGSSLTVGSNTTICTLTAALAGTVSSTFPFEVRVRLQGDSKSGIVQVGTVEAYMNNATMDATTNTKLTGISFLANASTGQNPALNGNSPAAYALSLVFGLTFGVSDANNAANLAQFAIA